MVRGKIVAHHVAGVEAKVVNAMCDLQSECEYVDEQYNRLKHRIWMAGAKANSDPAIQTAQKKVDDAWRKFSKAAEEVEAALSKLDEALNQKGLT